MQTAVTAPNAAQDRDPSLCHLAPWLLGSLWLGACAYERRAGSGDTAEALLSLNPGARSADDSTEVRGGLPLGASHLVRETGNHGDGQPARYVGHHHWTEQRDVLHVHRRGYQRYRQQPAICAVTRCHVSQADLAGARRECLG